MRSGCTILLLVSQFFFRGGGGDPFNGRNQNQIYTTFINFTIEFYNIKDFGKKSLFVLKRHIFS